MQVDSHSHFIWAWDVEILRNWKATGNAKAVISGTYPVPHTRMPEWLKRPHPQVPKGDGVVQVRGLLNMSLLDPVCCGLWGFDNKIWPDFEIAAALETFAMHALHLGATESYHVS